MGPDWLTHILNYPAYQFTVESGVGKDHQQEESSIEEQVKVMTSMVIGPKRFTSYKELLRVTACTRTYIDRLRKRRRTAR